MRPEEKLLLLRGKLEKSEGPRGKEGGRRQSVDIKGEQGAQGCISIFYYNFRSGNAVHNTKKILNFYN